MKKETIKQLKKEFGIHFKNSPDEFGFLEAFIEDLLEGEKEKGQKELAEKIRKIGEKYPANVTFDDMKNMLWEIREFLKEQIK